MIRLAVVVLAAALLQEAAEVDGSAVARDLLGRVEKKIAAGKTIRFAFRTTESAMTSEGELLWRPPDGVRFRRQRHDGAESMLQADGRAISIESDAEFAILPQEKESLAKALESICKHGYTAWSRGLKDPEDFFLGGKETIGGVTYQVITYEMTGILKEKARVRAWINTAVPMVFKRQFEMRAGRPELRAGRLEVQSWTETTRTLAFDEKLPDDEFALQSPKRVQAAVEGQVARSVELYVRFMGRFPRTLDDLDAAPKEGEEFWPEGGFWIGGKRPADVRYYTTADGRVFVGAHRIEPPTGGRIAPGSDRLRKFYSARLRLQLLSGAIEAYYRAYRRYPRRLEFLNDKPEDIEFWPEGGFASEASLTDPWGSDYLGRGDGLVMVARRQLRAIGLADLEPEEREGLRSRAFPPLSPEDRKRLDGAWNRFTEDDVRARDRGVQELLELGPAFLAEIEVRWIAAPEDLKVRLRPVRDRLARASCSWQTELRPLTSFFIPPERAARVMVMNERAAVGALRSIQEAQKKFRAVDHDGNGRQDYWVRDIAGLYGMKADGNPGGLNDWNRVIKLIDPGLAAADATRDRQFYRILGDATEPQPYGGFLFAVVKSQATEARSTDLAFTILATPHEYGVTSRLSFLANSSGHIWKQDLKGGTVESLESDPGDSGWVPLE